MTTTKSFPEIIPEKHPQEIEVWYVIPAIRKELTLCLINTGKSQREVASLLGLTEAAVSNYLKKKRAHDIPLPLLAKEFIQRAALRIQNQRSAYHEIHDICTFVKEKKIICEIHRLVEKNLDLCKVCFE